MSECDLSAAPRVEFGPGVYRALWSAGILHADVGSEITCAKSNAKLVLVTRWCTSKLAIRTAETL